MPWKCPACDSPIERSKAERVPEAGQIYRCPACRLNLIFDEEIQKLKEAPKMDDTPKPKRRLG